MSASEILNALIGLLTFVFGGWYLVQQRASTTNNAFVGMAQTNAKDLDELRKQQTAKDQEIADLKAQLAAATEAIKDMPTLRKMVEDLSGQVANLTTRVQTLESEKNKLVIERDEAIKRADAAEQKAIIFQAKYEALVAIGLGKPEVKP